uniref:Uncharacterized protein n=1 Tax=Cucumis melo TaxID=3656 RepID=A0A9I9ED58_CUCME
MGAPNLNFINYTLYTLRIISVCRLQSSRASLRSLFSLCCNLFIVLFGSLKSVSFSWSYQRAWNKTMMLLTTRNALQGIGIAVSLVLKYADNIVKVS